VALASKQIWDPFPSVVIDLCQGRSAPFGLVLVAFVYCPPVLVAPPLALQQACTP
jgi:hypothetical protein